MLLVFLHSSSIAKYGVHIKADFMWLYHDCNFQDHSGDLPFIGAEELGPIAWDHQVAEWENISLAELTAHVLKRSLPKDPSIRVSMEWNSAALSEAQKDYAVQDVYATWRIYKAFTTQPNHFGRGPVTRSTPAGVHVKLVSRDRCSTIAYGVIALDQPTTFNRVKVSKSCILINVTVVLMPGYLVRGELLKTKQETPLSELIAQLPSTLLCCLKDLQLCAGKEDSVAQPVPSQSTRVLTAPTIPLPNTVTQKTFPMFGMFELVTL